MSSVSSGIQRKDCLFLAAKTTKSNFGILGRVPAFQHCKATSQIQARKLTRRRHQHKNTIQALKWSPNGNLVASASRDQTVRVFDIRAMKEFRVLKGHKKEVCCKFSRLSSISLLTLFSRRMASRTPPACLRRVRRRNPALGPLYTRRRQPHTDRLAAACNPIAGTR
jgi:WD40 repeat protein